MLHRAFDDAPVGVAVLAADTSVLAANPLLEQMLGRRAGELAGVRFADLVDERIHRDGHTEVAARLADAAAGRAGAGRREVCLRAADDAMVWVLLRWAPAAAGSDGQPRLVVHAADFGADRVPDDAADELDELVQHLVDASGFGIAVGDLDSHILRVNAQLCELLGYSADELTSMTFEQITHPEDWSKSQLYVNDMREKGTQRHQTIKRYVARDGRVVYCRRAVYAGRGRDGVMRSVLVVIEPRGTA